MGIQLAAICVILRKFSGRSSLPVTEHKCHCQDLAFYKDSEMKRLKVV